MLREGDRQERWGKRLLCRCDGQHSPDLVWNMLYSLFFPLKSLRRYVVTSPFAAQAEPALKLPAAWSLLCSLVPPTSSARSQEPRGWQTPAHTPPEEQSWAAVASGQSFPASPRALLFTMKRRCWVRSQGLTARENGRLTDSLRNAVKSLLPLLAVSTRRYQCFFKAGFLTCSLLGV